MDLSVYPSLSTAAAEVDAFETTSTDFVPVPGSELSIIARTGETWLVLFSGRIGSRSTREPSQNFVSYTIDGVERGIGTSQSGVAGSLGPWQHLDWFEGTNAPVDIALRLRTGTSDTAYLADVSIVAFRVPDAAGFASARTDNAQLVTNAAYTPVATLTFTPEIAGDYLILGVVNGQESPGQSDIFVRFRTPTGGLWYDGLQNPRGTMQSHFVAHRITLDAAPQTFETVALGSSSGSGSTVRFARLVAMRIDGFDTVTSDEKAEQTSSTASTIAHVTTTPSEVERPHIVVQTTAAVYPCGRPDTIAITPGFVIDGVTTSAFDHAPGTCAYRATYGDVRLRTTADPIDASITLTPNAAANTTREASIHILRLPF